jgi:hypothetical protein
VARVAAAEGARAYVEVLLADVADHLHTVAPAPVLLELNDGPLEQLIQEVPSRHQRCAQNPTRSRRQPWGS